MTDIETSRRETLRWRIIQALNVGRPYPVGEDVLMRTVSGPDMPISPRDLRVELDYLEARDLATVDGKNTPNWSAKLSRYGVDIAEYTIDAHPGIARPVKYW